MLDKILSKSLSEKVLSNELPIAFSDDPGQHCVLRPLPDDIIVRVEDLDEISIYEVLCSTPSLSLVDHGERCFYHEYAGFILGTDGKLLYGNSLAQNAEDLRNWNESCETLREDLKYVRQSSIRYIVTRFHRYTGVKNEIDGLNGMTRKDESMTFVIYRLPSAINFMQVVAQSGIVIPEELK